MKFVISGWYNNRSHKIYNAARQPFSHRFDLVEQIKGRDSGIDAPGKAQTFGNRSKQGQVQVIKLDLWSDPAAMPPREFRRPK